MERRIKQLKSDIYRLIAIEDAFGLKPRRPFTFNTRFKFLTNDEKLKSFNAWLANQVKKGMLQVEAEGKPWTAKYIDSAYKKGRIDAFLKAHKKDYSKPEQWLAGQRDQFLRQAFSQPETVSKLRLLYTRDYQQLKGITADIDSKLSRILATGIVNGTAPARLASQISKEIDGINKKRARLIAHVEVMHAHAEGTLDSYEELGVEGLRILAEWSTAGDKRVCPRCNDLSGKIFTIKRARGLLPLHPLCRCVWLSVVGSRRKPSKLGKRQKKALAA